MARTLDRYKRPAHDRTFGARVARVVHAVVFTAGGLFLAAVVATLAAVAARAIIG